MFKILKFNYIVQILPIITVLFLLNLIRIQTQTLIDTISVPLGCYDQTSQETCQQTACSDNCVECESENICTVCSKGYFIFNTPEQTVDCLPCPGTDMFSVDQTIEYYSYNFQCGTCLEMPDIWQDIRQCNSRYFFNSQDTSENVFNITIVNPVMFYIRAVDPNQIDSSYNYTLEKNYYMLEQTEQFCGGYPFEKYIPEKEIYQDELIDRMNTFNKARCNICTGGRSWNNTMKICETCEDWDPNCNGCTEFGCTSCKAGYNLRVDEYWGISECVTCDASAHCLTCDPWNEWFCYSCQDGYEMDVYEYWDEWTQSYVQELSGYCYAKQQCTYEGTQTSDEADIINYYCWDCYNQLWIDAEMTGDYSVAQGCFQCTISGDNWNFIYYCSLECPPGQGKNYDDLLCYECSTIDENCRNCDIYNDDSFNMCWECEQPYIWDGFSCVTQAGDATDVQGCNNAEYNNFFLSSLTNEDSQTISFGYKEELYKNSKTLCLSCDSVQYPSAAWHVTLNNNIQWNLFQSMDRSGRNCQPVPLYCRYSLPFLNERYYESINPFYRKGYATTNPDDSSDPDTSTQVYWGNVGNCIADCEIFDSNDEVAGQVLFHDPVAKRCVQCDPTSGAQSNGMCRKKIVTQAWIQCDGQMKEENINQAILDLVNFDEILPISTISFLELFRDPITGEIIIDKDFPEAAYNELDMHLVQIFQVDINFLVNNRTEGTECFSQWDLNQEYTIANNFPNRVFRINDVSLNINTYNYENGEKNQRNVILGFTNERIQFQRWKTVSLNSVTFQYRQGQIDKNSERSVVEFNNNMPGAKLILNNCNIFSKYTAITFQYDDLTSLIVKNFNFDSVKAFDFKVGWPLFQNSQRVDYNKNFTLIIENFKLNGFLFNEENLFDLPLQHAYVKMENITFLNCAFKNAYILKDNYGGIESPIKNIQIKNLVVNDTMFSQSSGIVKLYSVNNFELDTAAIKYCKFFSKLSDSVNSIFQTNVMQMKDIEIVENTFQNFTLIHQEQERVELTYLKYSNFIHNLQFKHSQVSQPDYMLMVNLITPIEFKIVDFHTYNLTTLNASNNQYPFDIAFYSEVSTRKIYDKIDYIIKRAPGHKPVKDIVYDVEDEEDYFDPFAQEEVYWCENGYDELGNCWEPNLDVVDYCFNNNVDWMWIEDLSTATSDAICFNFYGEEISYEQMPEDYKRQEPYSWEDPTLDYYDDNMFEDQPEGWVDYYMQGGCEDGETGEWIYDADWCDMTYNQPLYDQQYQDGSDGEYVYGDGDGYGDGSYGDGEQGCQGTECQYSDGEFTYYNIPNFKQPNPPSANQMLTFMRISYSRSSENSIVNVTNFNIEYMTGINVLQIYDVDYVTVQNFTCGGNYNDTLFNPNCLDVQALSLEKTQSLMITNSTIQNLYATGHPIYISGPAQITLQDIYIRNLYLYRNSQKQAAIAVEQKPKQQAVNITDSHFENIAIIDYNQEYSASTAPIASITSRNITINNITSIFTVSLYSTSGMYLEANQINITNSVYKQSNFPIEKFKPAPACEVFNVTDVEKTLQEQWVFSSTGEILSQPSVPIQYQYYPKNNSCPFVNDFISNPDLPKGPGHKSCKDYYLYKLTFAYYSPYKVNGTNTLREYLSLGPKITTEGFFYLNQYKKLTMTNNSFKDHVFANSMINMISESNNGFSNITQLKVNSIYPNFRKENTGASGAMQFQGTKKHNFTLDNSSFTKTASRIKGGVLTFSTISTNEQFVNITNINITDTFSLQGGAFHIKGVDNEKTKVNITNVSINNTSTFYRSQSNTVRSYDDPEEDSSIILDDIIWPVKQEPYDNRTCINVTDIYNHIFEKEKEAEEKQKEKEEAESQAVYKDFQQKGCHLGDGTWTNDVQACEQYYHKWDTCYLGIDMMPIELQNELHCQIAFKMHTQYQSTGDCYLLDSTQITGDSMQCEMYYKYTTQDFSQGCYLDDGTFQDDEELCQLYFVDFSDFTFNDGCFDFNGQWMYGEQTCAQYYTATTIFEVDGGCYNEEGDFETDIQWCINYFYCPCDDQEEQAQAPTEVTGDYWIDGGCYQDVEQTIWVPDPYICMEIEMEQMAQATQTIYDVDGGCMNEFDEWIIDIQICIELHGYRLANPESVDFEQQGGCFNSDYMWTTDIEFCKNYYGINSQEQQNPTTGYPRQDNGCYDSQNQWNEDPEWCLNNGFASQEALEIWEAEIEEQEAQAAATAAAASSTSSSTETGDAAAELLSSLIVTDQLLTNGQVSQNLIYIEEAFCQVNQLNVKQAFNQSSVMVVHAHYNMTDSTIEKSKCSQYCKGAVSLINADFVLDKVNFDSNDNLEGGAVYIAGNFVNNEGRYANKTLNNCTFTNNKSQKGAGAFLDGSAADFKDSSFTQNTATVRGGGIYSKLAISNRRALASGTATLESSLSSTKISQNFGSLGGGLNYEGKAVQFLSESDKTLISGNSANVIGEESADIVEGCNYGEAQNSLGLCEECPSGKYTVEINAAQCLTCPNNCECPGGSQIFVNDGYWRPTIFNDIVEECHNLPENCVSTYKAGDEICSEGHIGALCESCDVEQRHWPESYSNAAPFICGKCSEVENNVLKVFLMNLWILLTMALSVKGTLSMIQQQVMKNTLKILLGLNDIDFDEAGILLKIFTNYFQIVSVIATFRLETPPGFVTISSAVGNPVQQMGYSLDCFLFSVQQAIPFIYFRIMWQYLVTFIQLIVFLLGFGVLRLAKKTPLTFSKVIFTTLIFIFINTQPSYIKQLMDLLSCRTISGIPYMAANVAFECYTDEYYLYTLIFLLPCLILLLVLIPAVLFIGLQNAYKNKQLEKIAIRFKYGFLYNEYSEQAYFWEFVKIFQKTIIIVIISYYEEHIVVKGTLVFLIIQAYGGLARKYTPYFKQNLNSLDQQSTTICSVSIVLGVFLFENKFDYWIWIGYIIIGVLNAYFILRMIHAIIYKYIAKIQAKLIVKIKEKSQKIKCLKKFDKHVKKNEEQQLMLKHFKGKMREHFLLYTQQLKKGTLTPAYDIFKEEQIKLGNLPPKGEFNERPDGVDLIAKRDAEIAELEQKYEEIKKNSKKNMEQDDNESQKKKNTNKIVPLNSVSEQQQPMIKLQEQDEMNIYTPKQDIQGSPTNLIPQFQLTDNQNIDTPEKKQILQDQTPQDSHHNSQFQKGKLSVKSNKQQRKKSGQNQFNFNSEKNSELGLTDNNNSSSKHASFKDFNTIDMKGETKDNLADGKGHKDNNTIEDIEDNEVEKN